MDKKYFRTMGSRGAAPNPKYKDWSRPKAAFTLSKTNLFAALNCKLGSSCLFYFIEPSMPCPCAHSISFLASPLLLFYYCFIFAYIFYHTLGTAKKT